MITDKINSFLSLDEDKPLNDLIINNYMDDCKVGLIRQAFEKRIKKKTLRLSSIGKCLRSQAYTLQGTNPDEALPARAKMTFLFGDLIEAIVVALAKSAGCKIYNEQKEVVLDGIKGHLDGMIDVDGEPYILEIKSMSDYSFKEFKKNGIMSNGFGYLNQVNAYCAATNAKGYIHVGVNKNTGHICEAIHKPDASIIHASRYTIELLKACNDPNHYMRCDTIPETWYRKATGNTKLDFVCSYCDYKKTCWGESLTYMIRKGKPIYYVGDWINCKANDGGKVIV